MRVGLYDPFLDALGGGERYFLTVLAEATRAPQAEVVLVAALRPDVESWAGRLGIEVDPTAFTWVQGGDTAMLEASRDLDLVVTLANDIPPRNEARRGVALMQFPHRARDRVAARARARAAVALGLARAPAAMASYDLWVCNSRFTQEHLARRLGVDRALLIPPPVDVPSAPPAAPRPERWIASVGRFFRGWHSKRQEVLIEAFRSLAPGAPGWELHLVGGATGDAGTQAYLAQLQEAARGLPVHFHVNAPAEQLDDVLWRAPLFWHAAGHGVDPARHPERLEHFGISTVEAMARGAVPLVVPAGGQLEIVEEGESGLFWRTPAELVERTLELIAAPPRREEMAVAARSTAQRFSTERFRAAVRKHVLGS